MQGLSLKNVAIKILDENGNVLYTDFGELMFTHFGVTGPIILSASAHLRECDISKLTLSIDLKPALDEKTLDARILSDFEKYKNKDFANALGDLLPQKMIPAIIRLSSIDPHTKVNTVTREQRRALVSLLKGLRVSLKGFRPIEEAIVTRGGVNVREVSPKTMESKILPGLYFAGEVLDVDAYTGGYNLQIAFSTAVVAGENAAWG
jgi:predicted Rossmann fold flavoprotein